MYVESSAQKSESWKLYVRFRVPVERCERASELVGERLDAEYPTCPVDDLSLTLLELGGEAGVQPGLFRDARESGRETLIGVDRRLSARFGGTRALHRAVDVAPWHPVPEMRSLLIPIDPLASDAIRALRLPTPAKVRKIAGEDGRQGVPVAVRVSGRWREIRSVTDRWTFDLWWMPRPIRRSYYRVESPDGGRLTLFRDDMTGRWYSQAA